MTDILPPVLRTVVKQHTQYFGTRCDCEPCTDSRVAIIATLRAVAESLNNKTHFGAAQYVDLWADEIERGVTP
jgi:hypothetical protein